MNFFQALEQLSASLRDTSPVLWAYYSDLKKQGFTDEQAFSLVKDVQQRMFN